MIKVRLMKLLLIIGLVSSIVAVAAAAPPPQRNFRAHLTGDDEVPANASQGQGQAIFQVNADETALSFKLNVANVDNITQAHIHCGAAGVNGPVVVFLYGFNAAGTSQNGRLSAGTATNAQVIARPSSPTCPGGVSSLADVIEKMRTGQAYVNVHTISLPPGEIRGQIR